MKPEGMKRIGIIAAMKVEMELIKEQIRDCQTETIAGTEYHFGKIGSYEIALTQCGIGKVSAALSAQVMILKYQPDCIINTGCAGGISEGLKIGDMVLSDCTVEWDIDMLAIGLPRGYVSALDQVILQADERIADWIAEYIPQDVPVHRGMVVSGDQFVSREEQRSVIMGAFPAAKCAEMEGAAIGHVCVQNQVPFCVVRCMSDTADGDSDVDFPVFAKQAGEKSADILLKMFAE